MKKKIESYQGAAGGWGAVKSVANAVRKQMDIRHDVIAMFDMNKPEGFDCPGCAMADRSLVTYFPESNHMLTLDNHDPLSGIPGYKSIPVELEPSN